MFLHGQEDRRIALCYSMNVHPGEGLTDVLLALEGTVAPLKGRLGVKGPFAVGLRLAARAAEEVEGRGEEVKATLERLGLVPVTVNAFPYGDFHGGRVKEEVYRPDWTESRRAVYTLRAAVALAAFAPRGLEASVSTVPLSYKAWRPSMNAVTGRVLEMISVLQGVERKSGRRVRVALEPEPLCVLETALETVAYWRDHLMPACRAKFGRGAEDLAHAYLGVCLDTCHHAVRWESSRDAIDLYREAGIPIGKIQLSSALEAASAADLEPFAEPRYLHQVVSRSGEARADLGADPPPGPLRCHFHVPVHREVVAGVRTTRDDMAAALRHALATGATNTLEIETYTWDVLPLKEGALLDSLEAEYRYVLGEAGASGFLPAA
ncbi:MAG TPA: metabolite traffic protein EboE [Planctomycetota bacterium]|nr:metabolite traffic protein EboE [Planctomycetota bacterium]